MSARSREIALLVLIYALVAWLLVARAPSCDVVIRVEGMPERWDVEAQNVTLIQPLEDPACRENGK